MLMFMISDFWVLLSKKRHSTVQNELVINNPKFLIGKPLALGDGNPIRGTLFEAN